MILLCTDTDTTNGLIQKRTASEERITTKEPYIYKCEPIFILYATGIPEPSDEERQDGSHSDTLYQDTLRNAERPLQRRGLCGR